MTIRRSRLMPCWVTAGTGSMSACSKWCSRWISCVKRLDKYRSAAGDYGVPIKINHRLPKGEVYLETEAPKGQMGFYLVSDGTAIPWRARARSSCFCNLSVTSELCRGCLLADVPAVVGSLDIVLGEIDR